MRTFFMKSILSAIAALTIITGEQAQGSNRLKARTIDTTQPVKATEGPGAGGKSATNGKINISPRLRDKSGASVFGGKFKYTTIIVHMQPGSHTLFAAGINGKLKYLFARDTKGNKIPATYSTEGTCFACIALLNGRTPCYVIDCNDVPAAEKPKVKPVN